MSEYDVETDLADEYTDGEYDDTELSEGYEYNAPEGTRGGQTIGADELDLVAAHTGSYSPERATGEAREDEAGQAQIDAFFREQDGSALQHYYERIADANAALPADQARETWADYQAASQATGIDEDTLGQLVDAKLRNAVREAVEGGASFEDIQSSLDQDPRLERTVRRQALSEIQAELAYEVVKQNALRASGLNR